MRKKILLAYYWEIETTINIKKKAHNFHQLWKIFNKNSKSAYTSQRREVNLWFTLVRSKSVKINQAYVFHRKNLRLPEELILEGLLKTILMRDIITKKELKPLVIPLLKIANNKRINKVTKDLIAASDLCSKKWERS